MTIYEQLKDYCSCVDGVSEDLIAELVNVISSATCWARNPCETFLKSERREVIPLPRCIECPMEFAPYYHPFDKESFTFYLVETDGMKETKTKIESVMYSEVSGVWRVMPGLPDCACHICGCEPEYHLLVEYTAGYEEIPDCLLPVFCNVIEVLIAKNDCSCEDCGCESKEEEVRYATGDVVSVAIETYIGQVLVEQYKKQLAAISLCKGRSGLWGEIV